MRAPVAAVVLAALALAPHARAAPPAEPDDLDELYAEAHPQPRHMPEPLSKPNLGKWYGWQILLADASFIAIFATAPAWGDLSEGGGVALALDAVGFGSVAPAIHGLHGDGEGGGVSLALHALLPLFGMLAGAGIGAANQCSGWFCGLSSLAWGAYGGTLSGAGVAAIVDATALAWEKPEPHGSSSVVWSVAPFGLRGGAGLGVRASF